MYWFLLFHVKRTAVKLSFLEKVFCYLLGVAKNYIMYWGGYKYYYTYGP